MLPRDQNGHLHFSLAYPGGINDQGDIPQTLSDYAKGLNLSPGEFRDPYRELR